MTRMAIFYGSSGGATRSIAQQLATALGIADQCYDIGAVDPAMIANYDRIILGTSTWGLGDIQDDWAANLIRLSGLDLSGATVALFGLGDACNYPDTFVDGLDDLYKAVTQAGATVVGAVPAEGYLCDDSRALRDGVFIGLPIDEDSQSEMTDERLAAWIGQLREQMA